MKRGPKPGSAVWPQRRYQAPRFSPILSKKRKKKKNQDVVEAVRLRCVDVTTSGECNRFQERHTEEDTKKNLQKKKKQQQQKKRERERKKKKTKHKTAPCPQVFGSGLVDGWLIQRLRAELRRDRAT